MLEVVVSREQALWDWVSRPPEHGDSMLFDFIRGKEGACSIALVDDKVVKTYINGLRIREYTFSLQIMLPLSDVDDNNNVKNMATARTWQRWIATQAEAGSFPDFGPKCGDYRLRIGDYSPTLAQMYDNNLARYDFYATLIYKEDK